MSEFSVLADVVEEVSLPVYWPLPRDPEDSRYIVSFDEHEPKANVVAFFEENGFVVLRDVFDEKQCERTRDAMWKIVENTNPGFQRDDPTTWSALKASGKYGLSTRGPSFDHVLVDNRQNPVLATFLTALIGCPIQDVMVSQDRFTIYRATVTPSGDGAKYATGPRNVHLDMNPWWWHESAEAIKIGANALMYDDPQDFIRENNLIVADMGRHVQCVLNFMDNQEEDGGTIVVPRFHKHAKTWAENHASMRQNVPFLIFPGKGDHPVEAPLLALAQRVPMRSGSVLVWDQRVFHGTSPNQSSTCRMGQFLKAFPRSKTFPNLISVNHSSSQDHHLSTSDNDESSVGHNHHDNDDAGNTSAGTVAESGLGMNEDIHPRLLRRAQAIQRELQLANNQNKDNTNNDDTTPVPCILSALGKSLFGLDVLQ